MLSMPKRFITGIMGFLAIVVAITMRECLSVAITEMVVPLKSFGRKNDSIICPIDNASSVRNSNYTSMDGTRYNWSQEQQGWILSSFYIGYVISHIPSGLLAEKFGGKWPMSLAVLILAICTIATPMALQYGGYEVFIVLRILMGLSSGTTYPGLSVILAAWIPQKERSKLGSIVLGGGQVGSIMSFYVTGLLLSIWPWQYIFYFWAIISIVWFIIFTLICYNDPASHPYISKEERDYLHKEIGQLKRHDVLTTPWKEILCSVPVLAYICAQIGQDFAAFIMSNDLPKYMKDVLGFSVYDVGFYSSLPYFIRWIMSIVSAFLCDFLINRNYISITQARKMFTFASGVIPAIFIVAASYAGCNRLLVVFWFVLAIGFFGCYYTGFRLNSLDLAPNFAGSLMALTNGIGALTGIAGPVFVGVMTPNSSLEEWRYVFWVTFCISMVRIVIYMIWGSAEIQSWNDPRESKSSEINTTKEDLLIKT
ncbi:sialin-like [Contarinia nasturtii]|uniref:sialin-like n=1 Tax=Contarinia nasturtii TaxID=265458 RepID=UPI0012D3D169|nr:sialin-like [Contarinia nasturtii]